MKNVLIFSFIVSVIVACGCIKKEEIRIISVVAAVGDVKIISQGKEISTSSGTQLQQSDTIITGKASFIDLNFLDKGIIRVGENSKVYLNTLVSDGMKENAELSMQNGKLVVTLSRLRKNSSFEVKTSTSVAAVRGTTLKIVSDESSSKVFVIKGKVSVRPVVQESVVAASEKVVEENYAVVLQKNEVKDIVEGKKEIKTVSIGKSEFDEIKEVLKEVVKTVPANIEMVREAKEIVVEEKTEEKEEPRKTVAPQTRKKDEAVHYPSVKKEQPVSQPEKKKTGNIPIAPNL